MKGSMHRLLHWLAVRLSDWGEAIDPGPPPALPRAGEAALGNRRAISGAAPAVRPAGFPAGSTEESAAAGSLLAPAFNPAALCPGMREPLSVEQAVLGRDLPVLKREAADALAALGAAHALVTSARLAQVQELRLRVEKGEVPGEVLAALANDYQGWQNDQVRLFDALALVQRMVVPPGNVLDQVDPSLHRQARSHLESLSTEYQRMVLTGQFRQEQHPQE